MTCRIVVIGSGPSAIAASTRLIENGFENVVIVEAENRFGGRINTVSFGNSVIDLGAQWCHGEEDNTVYKLASKYNLFDSSQETFVKTAYIRSNGEEVAKDATQKLFLLATDILEGSKEELESYNGSLGAFFVQKYNESIKKPEFSHIDDKTTTQFLDIYLKFSNSVEAADSLFEVSAKGFLVYRECEGDRLLNWKDKGFITILNILMGIHPNGQFSDGILGNKIQFNKSVDEITWNRSNGPPVKIKCTNGDIFDADHVICTVSLGVLKEKHMKLFSPSLSESKIQAIEGLGFGTVNKMFIEFPEKFWPTDWFGFNVLWEPEDLIDIRNSIDTWLEDVFGFYIVDYQPNVLVAWIFGEKARQMEILSSEHVLDKLMNMLRKFLKWNVPNSIAFKRSTWHSNENFRGSYSFRSMETERLQTSASALSEPLIDEKTGQPVVLFAGEATHSYYYSTVHGAIESGWREANRLIDLYSSQTHHRLCNPSMYTPINHNRNKYDVIILGAGLAGLGAANTFRKHSNLSFVILEAQNYIGGRIRTMNMLPYKTNSLKSVPFLKVESGAQWLHGKMNDLHKIAMKHNLLRSELSEEGLGIYIREDGYNFDNFFIKKVDFVIGQILEECETFINAETYPKSIDHYLVEKFSKFVNSLETKEDQSKAWQLLDWHRRFQVIDNACIYLNEVSAKEWGRYSYNGESCQAHINFRDGFSSIVDCLIEDIGSSNIRTEKEVNHIDWDMQTNQDSNVSISTNDGCRYYANHVITTFSVGVLKAQERNLFSPHLPQKYIDAIHNIGYEIINKIFLQFDYAWWKDLRGIQFIFNDDNYKDKKWTRHISGFDVLCPGVPNTLVGWVGGLGAIEMEKLTDEDIVYDCIEILQKFTKTHIPYPTFYFCSRWGSNKYIKGGYSYISTKCDGHDLVGRILSKPLTQDDLPNGRCNGLLDNLRNISLQNGKNTVNQSITLPPVLLFAGEACHTEYFSTAHGAFLSGIEQANNILKFYSKSN